MSKIIEKWWAVISLTLLIALYIWGTKHMYFHQDDLDWFMMANRPFWGVMMAPLSDHINYLFRLLLKFEWDTFHLFFPAYLFVSTTMHSLVIVMIYKVAKATSGRTDLAAISALIFTINTNWTEVVLWTSGQTISISALFVLFAMYAIWQKIYRSIYVWLSTFTSALALGLLPVTFLIYGIDYKKKKILKLGFVVIIISLMVILFYKYIATDGTKIEYSLLWMVKVMEVMGLAIINTVIGRLFIPFDKFETIRIGLVCVAIGIGIWNLRGKLREILKDKWSVFLMMQIFFYYLIVAIGRAQYGVGIMRAERYAYLGLALLLLFLVRILRKVKIDKWVWIVPCIVIIQCVGLYHRAEDYVVRPQILKGVVEQVQKDKISINSDSYLPHEIFNDERLKYIDLINLIGD
jgi:hypothetical protein